MSGWRGVGTLAALGGSAATCVSFAAVTGGVGALGTSVAGAAATVFAGGDAAGGVNGVGAFVAVAAAGLAGVGTGAT